MTTHNESLWDFGGSDLSYNNFTGGNSETCQPGNVNLFGSSSKASDSTSIVSCLRSSQCPKTLYFLGINCGGKEETINGRTYEDDTYQAGPSNFYRRDTWAFSSTGRFLDDDRPIKTYIAQNSAILSTNDPQLYTQARLSPLSLTYYGFCLGNGSYTVKLHFAEIIFTDDKTYSSLGRRVFDAYIQLKSKSIYAASMISSVNWIRSSQGKRVLKDFNIEVAAGGVGKAFIHSIPHVSITNKTVEIRFIWAGKGTTDIPTKGVYGPLISAISVEPEFTPPSEESSSISTGTVIGIVVGIVVTIILVVGILWWKGCLRQKSTLEQAEQCYIPNNHYVHLLKEKGHLMDLIDPRLGSDFDKEEVMVMINVALLCTNASSAIRPTMSSVVSMLEGKAVVPDSIPDSSISIDETKFEAMRNYYQGGREQSNNGNQSCSMSADGLWTGSSTSAADLYPLPLDSEYLITRN
ncbi:hypothetical protein Pint_04825 [Pistacia integerrima]|uniref:Uncharacterized protein n=1 Tax=Pistacia integerrima TaxID=434235 RepID=A0ACC0Z7Y8_9ROSI|nr:hypothetical protein Pint_04825 [Pistacia integerrima]